MQGRRLVAIRGDFDANLLCPFDIHNLIMYIYAIHKGIIMEAKIVDLRYRMKDVLRALDRKEEVNILYHGKKKGVIVPETAKIGGKVVDHPFFNMRPSTTKSVEAEMDELRGGRYNDI